VVVLLRSEELIESVYLLTTPPGTVRRFRQITLYSSSRNYFANGVYEEANEYDFDFEFDDMKGGKMMKIIIRRRRGIVLVWKKI
jgi:hypothetical protein